MKNILSHRQTKRFISGSIAAVFLLIQMPLLLLATPSVSAEHGNGGGVSGPRACPDNTVLLAKYEVSGNTYTADPDVPASESNVTIASTSTNTSGSYTVINASANVSTVIVKAGNHAKAFTSTNPKAGTFSNNDPIFLNNNERAAISNVQFCGTIATTTTGNVEIVKDVAGGTDTQDFNFVGGASTSPTSENFTLDDDGINTDSDGVGTADNSNSKAYTGIPAVEYTVTENAVTGWTVTGINCTNTEETVSPDGRTVTFTLAAGTSVVCTFTNTKGSVLGDQTGSLTIVKSAPESTNEEFGFTSSANTGAINSTFDLGNGDERKITPLTLGQTYTVTEDEYEGFTLDDIECDAGGTGNVTTRTATVMLTAENKDVTCTFTNVKDATGSITIVKQANPETGEEFRFSGNINPTPFFLSDDGNASTVGESRTFENLELGETFTVTESAFPGWTLEDISCTSDAAKNINNRNVVIELSETNKNVTCTFTNVKDATGSITIVKAVNPGVEEMFDFTSNMPGSFNFELKGNNSSESTRTTTNLELGETYTVKEEAKAGWMLQSISCTNAAATLNVTTGTVTITLTEANKDVSCTYTNARMIGGIGGEDGGRVLGASTVVKTKTPVLSLFTPQVLGASTSGPKSNQQLVNTGSTMLLNIFAGLFIIGIVGALTATQRRQYA